MSILGNNVAGASGVSDTPAGYLLGFGPFVAPASGSVGSVFIYLQIGTNARAGIYASSAGAPGALLGTSAETAVPAGPGWQEFTLTAPVAITSGQTYWIGLIYDVGTSYFFDAGTHQVDYKNIGYQALTNPFGAPDGVVGSRDYSAYAVIPDVPAAPSNLAAGTPTSSSIPLTWTDNASNETGFTLQYDTDPAFPAPTSIDIPTGDTQTGNVISLAASTLYYLRVRAYNGSGASAWAFNVGATHQYVSATTLGASAAKGANAVQAALFVDFDLISGDQRDLNPLHNPPTR